MRLRNVRINIMLAVAIISIAGSLYGGQQIAVVETHSNIIAHEEATETKAVVGAHQIMAALGDLAKNSETIRVEVTRFQDSIRAG
jgi:hypothetical protein